MNIFDPKINKDMTILDWFRAYDRLHGSDTFDMKRLIALPFHVMTCLQSPSREAMEWCVDNIKHEHFIIIEERGFYRGARRPLWRGGADVAAILNQPVDETSWVEVMAKHISPFTPTHFVFSDVSDGLPMKLLYPEYFK